MKKELSSSPILVLEDDDDDALLLQLALAKIGIAGSVYFVRDGKEGIAYLAGQGKYADRKTYPLLIFIITDIKMPFLNGLEFLKWLRTHPDYRKIPTLVLTSSANEIDVADAYGFGANSYMVKPSSFDQLKTLGKVIRDYWESCKLPPVRQPSL